MQMEKTLHAVLKDYVDSDPAHQEVPVGKYIADICREDEKKIVEIQTANMGALREKLEAFLPLYQVSVLYPIPHKKTIIWIDEETGEERAANDSHFVGSFYEVFRELYKISSFLSDPHLLIMPVLLDLTEYRLQDGWSRDKKRGSHRVDRIPDALYDELILQKGSDYRVFLPPREGALPEVFTAKEFEDAVGFHKRSLQYSAILRILMQMGVVERVGLTNRRAYQYRVLLQNDTGRDLTKQVKRAKKKTDAS